MSNTSLHIDFSPGKRGGFKQILYSAGTKEIITSTAQRIQTEANSGVSGSKGFRMNVRGVGYGGGRWGGFVSAIDRKANAAQTENQVLTRAVHT